MQTYCPDMKFQIILFKNAPENAREMFDETIRDLRRCAGLELFRELFCCAVSTHQKLAVKDRLKLEDLYGEGIETGIIYVGNKDIRGCIACQKCHSEEEQGGNTAIFDMLNKYFTMCGMPVASSQYWNRVHGGTLEKGLNQNSPILVDYLLGIGSFFGELLHDSGEDVLPGKSKLLTGFNEKLLLFLLGFFLFLLRLFFSARQVGYSFPPAQFLIGPTVMIHRQIILLMHHT